MMLNINIAKILSSVSRTQNAVSVAATPSDLSQIYFTSRSTGTPKGIKGKNSA